MRKVLLVCGALSSIAYIAADVLGSLRWEGYSYVDQTISELAALDAPSRPLVMPLFVIYNFLLLAFAAGVAQSGARAMRAAAAMLAAIALLGTVGFLFPIQMRGMEWTINETMHSVLTGLTVITLLLAIGFAGAAVGSRFRVYSFVTIAIALAAGLFSGWIGRGLATDQPTPWIGIVERISVFSYLLWVAMLSAALLRQTSNRKPQGHSRRAA